MATRSAIEWTGHTWNPLAGCSVLTPGCKRCYAMRLAKRLGAMGNPLYKGLTKDSAAGAIWTGEMRKAPRHTLLEPLRRKKPTTYFVNSMSDLFHENVPDEWIDEIFAVMALCPQHTFQVLTKRPERMREYCTDLMTPTRLVAAALKLPRGNVFNATWPLPNVWLGVSTERQQEADERIPFLLQTPAAVRFISAEPLLGPLDIRRYLSDPSAPSERREATLNSEGLRRQVSGDLEDRSGPTLGALSWTIIGGESGGGYRDMDPAWAKSLIDQCASAGIAVFMKQMAGKKPIPPELFVREFPRQL